ncbi:MAG: family 10 glycosylhydrolase [Verrucomicrobiia bacterium]
MNMMTATTQPAKSAPPLQAARIKIPIPLSLPLIVVACMAFGTIGPAAEPYHKTSKSVDYKCIFNHELLILIHKKDNNAQHIQSFINKLKDTDVDAVMCCPLAWRTNLFPSEVDPTWKRYRSDQPLSKKFPSWDYAMQYLHSGGDPVKDTLDACRRCGKDFFVSYRMNDHHHLDDINWPTHNDVWRNHPEYWLGSSDGAPDYFSDKKRYFNYMLPPVREYYFSILQELCTNYDVDGVELDFERSPRYFHDADVAQGTPVMTAFVKRVREMMDRIGQQRGKSLKLCVRVPRTVANCQKIGLDVPGWDAAGLVGMINVSSFFIHTMELGIEDFKANTKRAKIYGEMNFITGYHGDAACRFTTIPAYRASALNLWTRGVDGLCLFNYDYVPDKLRLPMTEGLKRITDVEYLKTMPKDYVITPSFGTFPAKNEKTVHLIIPDDTKKVAFQRAVLRIETKESCANVRIAVRLNGTLLKPCKHEDTELFPPLAQNICYPTHEKLKFYTVPLDALIPGRNKVDIRNLDAKKESCAFHSLEIALYR